MAARDIFSALGQRDFRWLWIGSVSSSFAMNMQIVARGWLVYTLTASELDLAWVTLSFMVPQVLLSLWGGVLADRLPKRRTIFLAQTLNCAATALMASIILSGSVAFWDFIWFGVFNGSVLALSMPARQAFVPELVRDDQIMTAMALNTTSWNLSRILGPALAGYLIAQFAAGDTSSHFGVGVVYCAIAGMYLLAALTVSRVSTPGRINRAPARQALNDMADGLRYVRDNPPVLGLILLSIVPFLFGMPLNTLLPAFNEDVLGGGADDLGFLMSVTGLGAIAGSLLLAGASGLRHQRGWLLASALIWGVATVAFGASRTLLLATLAIGAVGFVSAWNMALNRGLLQLTVAPHMRGRIMSIDMMSHGLMPLGVIPISLVAERYGLPAALELSGALFVASVLLLALFSRSVKQVAQPLAGR